MNLKDMKSSTVSLLITPIEDVQSYVERNQQRFSNRQKHIQYKQ